MHYVIADGRIFCGATAFSPDAPYTWRSGDVILFSTEIYHLAPFFRFANLLSAGGDGWGIEIDVRGIEATAQGFRVRAAVLHRISGNRQAPGAVIRLAQRLFQGVVPIDAALYLPDEMERIIHLVAGEGARPVIDFGVRGRMEATCGEAGQIKWRRFAG